MNEQKDSSARKCLRIREFNQRWLWKQSLESFSRISAKNVESHKKRIENKLLGVGKLGR